MFSLPDDELIEALENPPIVPVVAEDLPSSLCGRCTHARYAHAPGHVGCMAWAERWNGEMMVALEGEGPRSIEPLFLAEIDVGEGWVGNAYPDGRSTMSGRGYLVISPLKNCPLYIDRGWEFSMEKWEATQLAKKLRETQKGDE